MLCFFFITMACALACNADPVSRNQGEYNQYFIFSRDIPGLGSIELDPSNVTATIDALSSEKNTTIIVHGREASATSSLNPHLKNAALESEDMNVIVVDWSVYAGRDYSAAAAAVPSVGRAIANVVRELVDSEVVSLSTLHLIGFDLGAHVVGFTGRLLGGQVARITGLNPAGKNWGSNNGRLTSGDALYVEGIHTDAMGLVAYGIGDPVGNVDFYPNGGSGQPGCGLNNWCSHNRAWEFMADSFRNTGIIGNRCDSWSQVTLNRCRGQLLALGNNEFVKFGSGIYRVNTRRSAPFAEPIENPE